MINFVTYYNNNYSFIGDYTSILMNKYCKNHEYKFFLYKHESDICPIWETAYVVYYELLKLINNNIDGFIVYCDIDSLIVNQNFDLNNILNKINFIGISQDSNGECFGFYILKVCNWSLDFMKSILFLGDTYEKTFKSLNRKRVQDTVRCMIDNFPNINEKIYRISEEYIQNPSSKFSDKAFVMHYWNCNRSKDFFSNKISVLNNKGWCEDVKVC